MIKPILTEFQNLGKEIQTLLGIPTSAVAVRFVVEVEQEVEQFTYFNQHRYCQTIMKARHGQHVILDADGIACPAAAGAFGFRCYGCREATDLSQEESIIGFPTKFLTPMLTNLRYLAQKAIPKSRHKAVYQHLVKNSS